MNKYSKLFFTAAFFGMLLYPFLSLPIMNVFLWFYTTFMGTTELCANTIKNGGSDSIFRIFEGCAGNQFSIEVFTVAIVSGVVAVIVRMIENHD